MSNTKWTSTAGPRQTKEVNEALGNLRMKSQSKTEIVGVVGGVENSFTLYAPFGPSSDGGAYERVGNKFAWIITRENFRNVIAELERETSALEIPIVDKRRSPEEEKKKKEAVTALDREREEKEAVDLAERKRIEGELRAANPWTTQYDGLSPHARASACLKHLLSEKFPGVKFSVRSSTFSMGDSVDIGWELGPTTAEVKAISGAFQHGHFDGMQDMYIDDYSPEGRAHEAVFGRAKFVSENRTYPRDLEERIERDMNSSAFTPLNTFGPVDVNRLLHVTPFAANEEYEGLEPNPNDPRLFYRIVKVTRQTKSTKGSSRIRMTHACSTESSR